MWSRWSLRWYYLGVLHVRTNQARSGWKTLCEQYTGLLVVVFISHHAALRPHTTPCMAGFCCKPVHVTKPGTSHDFNKVPNNFTHCHCYASQKMAKVLCMTVDRRMFSQLAVFWEGRRNLKKHRGWSDRLREQSHVSPQIVRRTSGLKFSTLWDREHGSAT